MKYFNSNPNEAIKVENIRKKIRETSIPGRYRMSAEVVTKDGSRWIYRARSINQDYALNEILSFVDALEKNIGPVMWRLRGEKTFHMGTNVYQKNNLLSKLIFYFFGE